MCGKERTYIFDLNAFYLLSELGVSKKIIDQISDLTDEREISEAEMQELLNILFSDAKKGINSREDYGQTFFRKQPHI